MVLIFLASFLIFWRTILTSIFAWSPYRLPILIPSSISSSISSNTFLYMSISESTNYLSIYLPYSFSILSSCINLWHISLRISWSSIFPKKEGRLVINLALFRFKSSGRSCITSSSISSKPVPLNPIFFNLMVSFMEGSSLDEEDSWDLLCSVWIFP